MFPFLEQSPLTKRHSLSTGFLNTADLEYTFIWLTKPLLSGKVSTILPSSQEFWSKVSVGTRTTLQIPLVIVSAARTWAHNFLPRIQDTDTFQVNSARIQLDRPVHSRQIYILLVKFKHKPSDINKPYLQLHFAIEFHFHFLTSNVSHGQILRLPGWTGRLPETCTTGLEYSNKNTTSPSTAPQKIRRRIKGEITAALGRR